MKEIILMEKYNLDEGYYATPKLAEIHWQDRIEKVCKQNGLNLCWWQLLGYEHDLFMDFVGIYSLREKDEIGFGMEFMNAYVDYVEKLIEKVNIILKEKVEFEDWYSKLEITK